MKNFKRTLFVLCKLILSLVLIVFLIKQISFEFTKVRKVIFDEKINDFFVCVVNYEDVDHECSEKKLRSYLLLLGNSPGYFNDKPEFLGWIGLGHHFLGNDDKAILFYKKALRLKPDFFWFNYNLGRLYFDKQEYVLAAKMFQQALALDSKLSLEFVLSSQYYSLVAKRSQIRFQMDLENIYSKDRQNALDFLILSNNYKGRQGGSVSFDKVMIPIEFF